MEILDPDLNPDPDPYIMSTDPHIKSTDPQQNSYITVKSFLRIHVQYGILYIYRYMVLIKA